MMGKIVSTSGAPQLADSDHRVVDANELRGGAVRGDRAEVNADGHRSHVSDDQDATRRLVNADLDDAARLAG
jgi:hypothetical protein